MGQRSGLLGCMVGLLVLVAVVGLYFMIDNFNLTRKSQAEIEKALTDNTRELRRLRQLLESGDIGLSATATTEEEKPGQTPDFHNSDLRDPLAEEGGKRITAISSFSGNMNYIISNEGNVGNFWDICNDSLGARNYKDPKKFEPRLARNWEVSADGKTITVHLRPGVYWQDFTDPATGTEWHDVPVTADSFAFYLDTIRNPNLPTDAIRNYFKDLDRIEVIDEFTFKVIWKETYFRSLEFTLGMQPLPRHLYRPDPKTSDEEFAEDMLKNKAERNQIIVGCGPYRFVKYIKGERIIFEHNPDYYGPLPPIRTIEIRQIKDSEKELIEFERGELDATSLTGVQWNKQTNGEEYLTVCDNIDKGYELTRAHDISKKEALLNGEEFGTHKFEKYLYRRFAYTFIAWNMRTPLLSDRQVRRALTHCVDRKRIIKEVFFGMGKLTTGNFVPHSLYYDHTVEPWPFDIDKAKSILAKAGWEDTDGDGVLDKDLDGDGKRDPFQWTFLMISNHPYQSRFVPMIQEDMKKARIDMRVKSADWSVYMEQIDKRNFDACSFYWGGGIESDPYQLWHGSQADKEGSSNVPGFDNPEANAIMEEARRTLDLEKRTALYQKFHRIIHEEQPYTFLFSPYSMLAQRKEYCNVTVYPLGISSSLMWIPKRLQR